MKADFGHWTRPEVSSRTQLGVAELKILGKISIKNILDLLSAVTMIL